MKKIYRNTCLVLLGILLLAMLISLIFPLDAAKPKLTLSGVLDGSYFDESEAYFSDALPLRAWMEDDFETLDGFYSYGDAKPK